MEIDHDLTDEVVCPHCGREHSDSWELRGCDGQTIECGNCSEEFVLTVNFSVTYSTEKKDKTDGS